MSNQSEMESNRQPHVPETIKVEVKWKVINQRMLQLVLSQNEKGVLNRCRKEIITPIEL